MATDSIVASRVKCPVCGSAVTETDLGRAGLTKEELTILKRHMRDATFGAMLQLVDIGMKRLNPEKMSQDLIMKDAVAEIYKAVDEVREKIAGPAIGKIGETIAIKDFKAVMPNDEFSDEKSDKGTDIVATVIEDKVSVGKIAISVKYDNSWKSEFIQQLVRNMKHEATNFGILVTKSFPKEALSDKAWVKETSTGGMMLVVKPEYASVAYYGYRQAVIAWHEADRSVKDAESRIKERNRVFNAIVEWIKGKQFNAVLSSIDDACKLSEATDSLAENLLNYTEQRVKKMWETQKQLRTSLASAETAIQELKELLKPSDGDGGKNHPSNGS